MLLSESLSFHQFLYSTEENKFHMNDIIRIIEIEGLWNLMDMFSDFCWKVLNSVILDCKSVRFHLALIWSV